MSDKLFVGGLSWGTTDEALRAAFAAHGEVTEVRVVMDRETGRSRGFGFVTFATAEGAAAALRAMEGADLDGRTLSVKEAVERDEGGGGRPRTAGAGAPRSGPRPGGFGGGGAFNGGGGRGGFGGGGRSAPPGGGGFGGGRGGPGGRGGGGGGGGARGR